MSKIDKSKDFVSAEPPKADSGDNFFSNPQLDAHESAIPEGKDWNSDPSTSPEEYTKAQPFKKKGSGYVD
jgi:hypothetical protein